jgi:hypothetical protein
MSHSATSKARIQAYRFWPGDEQNKENRLGGHYGQLRPGQPERHGSALAGLLLPDGLGGHCEVVQTSASLAPATWGPEWARSGPQRAQGLFSFANDEDKLQADAAAGPNARTCSVDIGLPYDRTAKTT